MSSPYKPLSLLAVLLVLGLARAARGDDAKTGFLDRVFKGPDGEAKYVVFVPKEYAGKGYGDLKGDLAEVVAEVLTPFRERALGYLDDPAALDEVLAAGAEKARAVAARTLEQVYDRVGFLPGS